jgi:hypothetical protein
MVEVGSPSQNRDNTVVTVSEAATRTSGSLSKRSVFKDWQAFSTACLVLF